MGATFSLIPFSHNDILDARPIQVCFFGPLWKIVSRNFVIKKSIKSTIKWKEFRVDFFFYHANNAAFNKSVGHDCCKRYNTSQKPEKAAKCSRKGMLFSKPYQEFLVTKSL